MIFFLIISNQIERSWCKHHFTRVQISDNLEQQRTDEKKGWSTRGEGKGSNREEPRARGNGWIRREGKKGSDLLKPRGYRGNSMKLQYSSFKAWVRLFFYHHCLKRKFRSNSRCPPSVLASWMHRPCENYIEKMCHKYQ